MSLVLSDRKVFELDDRADWFVGAEVLRSPNCDERPPEAEISLAIVHGISLPPGLFAGRYIEQLFTNQLDWDEHCFFNKIRGLKVSSHLLIDRLGLLTQFVPISRRAWHAGQSEYSGEPHCNDFSVGIELEGTDHVPYTAAQYHALAGVLTALMARYPRVTRSRIVGHCDVAPKRKTDPGASFRWDSLHALLGAAEGL
ncbi:MAG: AmpD protein [Gammaproteobacteria bacterium]|jgi:AmpD protein